jgi:CrcB protein
MLTAAFAVSIGASCGALLRWQLGIWLNQATAPMAWGTLLANGLGGFIVGLSLAFFADHPSLSPQWRLLVITGFCGGLTTFSTFSAEVLILLQQGRSSAALLTVASHLALSLALTGAGLWCWQFIGASRSSI